MKSKKSAYTISSIAIIGLIITFLIIVLTSCNKSEFILPDPILKPEKIPGGWQYTVIGKDDTLIVHVNPWSNLYDSITVK